MLTPEDRKKLEAYIDKRISSLKDEAAAAKSKGISGEQLISKVTNMTVNKLTPESKMLMSSAYNMMMEHTLSEAYFSDVSHEAAFYSANILTELTNKFKFNVPNEIDYNKGKKIIKKLVASGVITVTVVGGVVSIAIKSWTPITVAFGIDVAMILVGIMGYILSEIYSKRKIDTAINSYFDSVKKSIMGWIGSVNVYYDKRVAEIKGEG